MTNADRLDYFYSEDYRNSVKICLLDWAGYWTANGLDEITDEKLKTQTTEAINLVLGNLDETTLKVAECVITVDAIKNAETVTDEMIMTAVNSVMGVRLEWITNIH